MPPSGSASLQAAILSRLWSQWISLGVDAVGEGDPSVVDPEALIAATAEIGDADARLRDASTDWCVTYGRYVNGARLRQVVRELGTPADSIGGYVATVAAANGPTWPMGTVARSDYRPRGKARLDSAAAPARLRIRLRAAFGVNARADVLAALLADPRVAMSISDLARRTRFTKPNIALAIDALVLAGLAEARPVGNERRIVLASRGEILPGLRPGVAQPDWIARFGVALRVLRFAVATGEMSTLVRSIEARALVEDVLDPVRREGMPIPDLGALGDQFGPAFDRWVLELSAQIAAVR